MATVALFYLALTLNVQDGKADISPINDVGVIWFFSEKSCTGCALAQIEFMSEWYRDGDVVMVKVGDVSSTHIKRRLEEIYSKVVVVEELNEVMSGMVTGLIWQDKQTGEKLMYSASAGVYSVALARSMLKIVRYPQ